MQRSRGRVLKFAGGNGRAGDVAKGAAMGASAASTQTLPKLPTAPPAGSGKILPRGSLLDVSV
ncbi:MAG: hypothetical protein ACREFS_03560 [Acetobacteraceae bacterium]